MMRVVTAESSPDPSSPSMPRLVLALDAGLLADLEARVDGGSELLALESDR